MNDDYILKHYARIAETQGLSGRSTLRDSYLREVETRFVKQQLSHLLGKKTGADCPYRLLDMGCGNGYTLSHISAELPQLALEGLEFTPELAELARSRNLPCTTIQQGDCRELPYEKDTFDFVLSQRVVINVLNRKKQNRVLSAIARIVKPGGYYLMIESFCEPMEELNEGCAEMGQEPIEPSPHNRWLREHQLVYLERGMMREVDGVMPKNYLSTYFYTSRVVHPSLRPEGGRLRENRFTRFITEGLGPAVGNYSPILLRVFKKSLSS